MVEYLHKLWTKGVQTFDAFHNTAFNIRAILTWVIHEFPAYENMSGCTIKGFVGCSICDENTYLEYLKCSKNTIYLDHRRFLSKDHLFCHQKISFNGQGEQGKPKYLTRTKILQKL